MIRTKPQQVRKHFKKVGVIFAVLTLAVIAGNTLAQGQRPQQDQFRPKAPIQPSSDANLPSTLISPNEDYRIGPGDVIDVQVEDAPELSRTLRITASGTFSMPFLGRVTAQQKTTEELAKVIADSLRGRYLKEPNVSILVRQINSRSFFIQGAVVRPGAYQIEGRPSLLELITVGGGLVDVNSSTAFVLRRVKQNKPDQAASNAEASQNAALPVSDSKSPANIAESDAEATYEMIKVNISGLLKGHFDQNTMLEAGDIVHIPPSDIFFVAGEVNSPGSFPLKEGTTLRQAISLSQGMTFKAIGNRGVIFREDPNNGQRQELKIDVAAIMSGKKEDIPILANDIIIIPNSKLKTVGSTLLNAFGVNAARLPGRLAY